MIGFLSNNQQPLICCFHRYQLCTVVPKIKPLGATFERQAVLSGNAHKLKRTTKPHAMGIQVTHAPDTKGEAQA